MRLTHGKLFAVTFLAVLVVTLLVKACVALAPSKEHPPKAEAASFSPVSAAGQPPLPVSLRVPIDVYDHTVDQIVAMDLEEYLTGVVDAEMPSAFEPEALKCQAIAARTFTVAAMRMFGGKGCSYGGDVCTSSQHCQAYNPSKKSPEVRKAVAETAGLILTYQGEPIEALYHSTAGGMTEDSENVFANKRPYLRSVISDETDAPYYTDTVTFGRAYFASRVNKQYAGAKLKAVTLEDTVSVLSRYDSGRVDTIKLGGVKISGKQLRTLFSLRSTNISIAFTKDNVVLTTRGFGHGVGMSQTGANDMAKNGAGFAEILTYYYTGTSVQSLAELQKNDPSIAE